MAGVEKTDYICDRNFHVYNEEKFATIMNSARLSFLTENDNVVTILVFAKTLILYSAAAAAAAGRSLHQQLIDERRRHVHESGRAASLNRIHHWCDRVSADMACC